MNVWFFLLGNNFYLDFKKYKMFTSFLSTFHSFVLVSCIFLMITRYWRMSRCLNIASTMLGSWDLFMVWKSCGFSPSLKWDSGLSILKTLISSMIWLTIGLLTRRFVSCYCLERRLSFWLYCIRFIFMAK